MPLNPEIIFKKKIYNATTDAVNGMVVFDDTSNKIYVGGNCFSSDVKNASLNANTGVLTIIKADDSIITVNLGAFEETSNKVTTLSSSSTDTEYPSAKCVYRYAEEKPIVVWEAQNIANGILASESDVSQNPNWQLTGLDFSKYQKVKLFIRSGGTGNNTTSSGIIKIDLGRLNQSVFGHFLGSTLLQYPNNRNKLLALSAAISEDKTSVLFNRTTGLSGTIASSENSDGRVLYKIVGYPGTFGHDYQIYGPNQFTGKNFNLQSKFDGVPVTSQWVLVTGTQYAVINQWGRVDIEPDTVGEYIVVQASYMTYSEQKTIQITYDNQLIIQCPDTITGETGSAVALYNNNGCVPVWSITSGSSNATINEYGEITILQSGDITIQAVYNGYTTTKNVTLEYQAGTTQETVINPDGSVTETTTTETTDPQTGVTTTETTSTTTNEDGSTSYTSGETTENPDGSSTSSSTTTNSDGTSSETETTTSAPDPQTGSVTSNTNTTNYDENGDTTGSQTNTTTENTDGSSTSTTTNYNAEGDPTNTTNEDIDSEGNNSTQNIDYDENGDPTVTGYEIDTSGSSGGEKEFNENGVNTEFYGFDVTDGFKVHIHFTIDFTHQPANQDENHHNILTMKRATPSPWYGFQLRQTGTTKSIILGTQFSTGSNTNTTIAPSRYVETNVAEYDIEITYNPLLAVNSFVATNLINNTTIFQSNGKFPDISELEYLTVCIGYALDENGDPFRYSNINVSEFSITKLSKIFTEPIISCDGKKIILTCDTQGVDIYYKLNHSGSYTLYTGPIDIYADTFIEAYSQLGSETSEIVSQTCIYIPEHDYSQDYLTFKVITSGSIAWQAFGTGYTKTIEYSINNGTWTSITASTTPPTFAVLENDVVRFRGSNSTYAGSKANYDGFEGGTATFNIEGNIMSLVYGDNFIGNTTLSGTYNFCSIFKKSKVVSAENLILPTMTLTNYCYRAMFSLAPLLEVAPAILPATTLAQGCYWYMFEAAPITEAPELPAPTLVRECYGYMFTGCTSLTYIKCLATGGFSTTQCLSGWVNNVASSGIFVKDANASDWTTGNNGIPANWIVQTA